MTVTLTVTGQPENGVTVISLTDRTIRNAKPGKKPVKLPDGKGLYLLVTTSGGKWWRFDYRFAGKRKTLSMGVYPEVSLKDARARRHEARELLANGAGGTSGSGVERSHGVSLAARSVLELSESRQQAVKRFWRILLKTFLIHIHEVICYIRGHPVNVFTPLAQSLGFPRHVQIF